VVLDRLLRISRMKGEDHPDVATAIAGLAVVHRGLGDDAAAEQHYRHALRIREKALAPDHMATVVTLEQLSATCAARGNRAEALALLERALPTREAALGADHPTAAAIRERIAALRPPLKDLVFIYQPEPPVRRHAPLPRQRAATPARAHAIAAAMVAFPVETMVAPPVEMAPPPHPVRLALADAPVPMAALAEPAAPQPTDWAEHGLSMRTALFSSAGLATVVFAIASLISDMNASAVSNRADARVDAGSRIAATTSTPDGSASRGAQPGSAPSTTDTPRASHDSATAGAAQSGDIPKLPSLPAAPKRLAAMSIPIIATKNLDSLVRVSTRTSRESFADQIGSAKGIGASALGGDEFGTPPALIGQAPTPYFPEALRSQRAEGEVLVRFRVDEHGRVDVPSMKVVKTDHELFTLAVRNVLPRFRFEPARSAAPESKPRAEWVNWRAEFTLKH